MHITQYKSLLILCLLVTAACACGSLPARASQVRGPQESKERFPNKGLRITEVFPGSPAEKAGLQPMDEIFRYGDFAVVDDASFFAARDTYENNGASEVPIVIWRGKALQMTVPPGKLGIQSVEYSPVALRFYTLVMSLEVMRGIAEHQQQVEFKGHYTPPKEIVDEGTRLIDEAERDSTMTPAQILISRIYLILDDASPEDLKRQSEMLAQLISTQPASLIHMLGQDRFFNKQHYRPAVECFKRHLELHPDDVSIRLNMGVAYHQLGMFAEAEAAADYVVDHQLPLGPHGVVVSNSVKAMALLGQGDYANSIVFGEKAFAIEPSPQGISLIMLAAAQAGDMKKFAETVRKYQQALPEKFETRKLQVAALEALVLVKNNQRDRAKAITQKWKGTDRIEGRLKEYWKTYPRASDIWNNWNDLTRN